MKAINNFCAFILTHGRPDNVYTYHTLKRCGYTGKIFIVIDNEDETAGRYLDNFGSQVIMFDKERLSRESQECDNFTDRRAILYARNVCFELAREKGFKYFIELDDDYTQFNYRFNDDFQFKNAPIRNLDAVFSIMLEYFKSIPAKSIAMAQGGDFIGGQSSGSANLMMKRKCMNTFICSTDRPIKFLGRMNDDVNTYVFYGGIGELFFTIMQIAINQNPTQLTEGGMSELYSDSGTYVKSMYAVMINPSCVKIALMGNIYKRLHHFISWRNAVPMIMDEKYKKQ